MAHPTAYRQLFIASRFLWVDFWILCGSPSSGATFQPRHKTVAHFAGIRHSMLSEHTAMLVSFAYAVRGFADWLSHLSIDAMRSDQTEYTQGRHRTRTLPPRLVRHTFAPQKIAAGDLLQTVKLLVSSQPCSFLNSVTKWARVLPPQCPALRNLSVFVVRWSGCMLLIEKRFGTKLNAKNIIGILYGNFMRRLDSSLCS